MFINPADKVNSYVGIGVVGLSLAFGLTVMMAYAIGHISSCHLNPAVSLGLVAGKRFPASELFPYIGSQLFGGVAGAGTIYLIASNKLGFVLEANDSAVNGFGALSLGSYPLIAGFILAFMFLMIIMGATDRRVPQGLAPIAIGLGLTLIHLIGIPITNVSVNPARSLGPALFVGGEALSQVWLFFVAPILGAIVAGFLYALVFALPSLEQE